MRTIPSTKGFSILCDDEDYDRLSAFRWYAHNNGERGRKNKVPRPARRRSAHEDPKRSVVFLVHELLGKPPRGQVVDHINGDVWDNRRCNLRIASIAENCRNQRRPRKASGAGKGVHWVKGAWYVKIMCDGVRYDLASWDNLLAAELAYDSLALFLHGEFASLNHPEIPSRAKSPDEIRAELEAKKPTARVIPLLRAGLSATEAARRAGCSISTACNAAKRLGLPLSRGRPRKAAA